MIKMVRFDALGYRDRGLLPRAPSSAADEYDIRTFSHSFITQTRNRTRLSYLLLKNSLQLSLLAPSCYAILAS